MLTNIYLTLLHQNYSGTHLFMLLFSNAKINLGLYVTSKRDDGFHNIETIFYPIGLKDIIEFLPSSEFNYNNSGYIVDCPIESNIIVKAYKKLQSLYNLPEIELYLHKNIPFGAGLGGGSSNASTVLKNLASYFNIDITLKELYKIAEELGSDCPFFLKNKPCKATSKGEVLEEIDLDLSAYYFAIVKPAVNISTKDAYASIKPKKPNHNLLVSIDESISEWKNLIYNDFEESIFPKFPEVKQTKEKLYELGAEFALMSGSGASVFGLFQERIELKNKFPDTYFTWIEKEKQANNFA